MHSFFFHELYIITVLLLIRDSYLNCSTQGLSLYLSILCVGFSIFDSLSFLLEFMFLFNKKHGVLVYDSFQNENNRKATHGFAPRSLIFKLQQVVLKFKISA